MRGLRYAWALAALSLCGIVPPPARAGVTTTGDIKDDGSLFSAGYNANKTGTLAIDAGSVFSRGWGYLGYNSGSTGSATVTGAGSKWTNSNELYIGYSGGGTLQVEAGGEVSSYYGFLGYSPYSTSSVTITGPGSKWTNSSELWVGRSGGGTLRVEAGAQVSSAYGLLGNYFGSTGEAIITGAGSKWTNSGNLSVGQSGSGTLRVEAGGQVSDASGYVRGTAIITGAGSKWTNSSELWVGRYGSGTLAVSDGGLVSAKTLYASLTDLYGNGSISVQSGGVLDADLSFDAIHGQTQTLEFGSGGAIQFTVDGTTELGVGYKQSGSLRIADGRSVTSTGAYLGYYPGSTGAAIVAGAGSKWTSSDKLYAGYFGGSGTLRVEDGAQVSSRSAYLGYESGSTGTAIITGAGSKWTNSGNLYVGYNGSGTLTVSDGGVVSASTLYASLSDLHGNGTITVQSGAFLDGDLVFDAARDTAPTVAFGNGGTLQLPMDATGPLAVGYNRSGSLRIAAGRSIVSGTGYLGFGPGSSGTAIITGAESKWANSGPLNVGWSGSGTLRVEAGGQVSSSSGYLSTGAVIITGAGSKWTNSGELCVGYFGTSMLTVSDGGQVTASKLTIDSQSSVRLQVGGDRMLVLGDASTVGSVSNSGKLSLQADAFLPAGTYRPIAEYAGRNMSWSGSGSTLAIGATWDSSSRTFTVIDPTLVNAGTPAQVAGGMRLLIGDPASGERLGVSFGTLSSGTALAAAPMLTVVPLTQDERSALIPLLDANESLLSAWSFTAQLAGDEALLSFEVGLGAEDLHLWRLSQTGWSEYKPEMLTYDSHGIVSFTLDPASLNSAYAVTATVPEPAALALLLLAPATLLPRRRR